MLRARRALKSTCRGGFNGPLTVPEDGYAKFSSRIASELEGVGAKVDAILEAECRDLFFVATTCVFSHLYLHDASFDFDAVTGLVPLELRTDTTEAVKGHVVMLLGKFTYLDGGSTLADAGGGGDNIDDDGAIEDEPAATEASGGDGGNGGEGPSP